MANDKLKKSIVDEILDEGVLTNSVMRALAGAKEPMTVEMMSRDGSAIQFKVKGGPAGPRYFMVRVSESY